MAHHHRLGEDCGEERFRVWIVAYQSTPPTDWHAPPARAVAVEPVERGTMSARQAGLYVEAFNQAASNSPHNQWAVALPVTIHYEGDPQPGQLLGKRDGRPSGHAVEVESTHAAKSKKPAVGLSGLGQQRATTAGFT
jgi:hypothetical protein